jgi:peptide/nickel transport system ATP-binding protein
VTPDARASGGDPAPLLDVRGLHTHFVTDVGIVRAVDGVSLTLHAASTLGIVGESGSGKSVLARSIMGLLPSNAGHLAGDVIEFGGDDILAMSTRERRNLLGPGIGMVFQDPMTALTPTVRIGRHVVEPLRRHFQMGRSDARNRAVELLTNVGIPDAERRMRQYPHQLSGGLRQRVVIARALSCRPRLLIADEPTTALDVTVQRQILDLLERLQREYRMALILVSHDLGVVATRTDRLAVMYAGRVVETGPTRAVTQQPRHPYTRALIDAIPRLSGDRRQRLQAVPGRPPSLLGVRQGCAFAPRCPRVQPDCRRIDPVLAGDRGGRASDHQSACHHPHEYVSEIGDGQSIEYRRQAL